MLFADQDLAARIERAECDLLRDGVGGAARRGADTLAREIAGGVATYGGPGSPLNKLAGLGFGGPLDDSELAAVEVEFDRRETALQVELSALGDPAIGARLSERGYLLRGFENVLGLRLPAADRDLVPGVDVQESPLPELSLWLDVVVSGFAAPDEQGVPSHESFPRDVLERVIGDLASSASMRRYLARRGGEPAGGASLRIGPDVAVLCGAATLPGHRRRGVQTGLLGERLRDAARAGCTLAVVTTQPGSRSQQNVQRQGFALLYTRAVLVRPGPGAATS